MAVKLVKAYLRQRDWYEGSYRSYTSNKLLEDQRKLNTGAEVSLQRWIPWYGKIIGDIPKIEFLNHPAKIIERTQSQEDSMPGCYSNERNKIRVTMQNIRNKSINPDFE